MRLDVQMIFSCPCDVTKHSYYLVETRDQVVGWGWAQRIRQVRWKSRISSLAEATRKRDEAGWEEYSTASKRITRVKLDEIKPFELVKFINEY